MRKFIIGLVIASTAALSVPAAAQYRNANPYNYPPSHPLHPNNQGRQQGGYGYNEGQTQQIAQRIDRLGQRIDNLSQRGAISRGEANRLSRELEQVDRLYDRYARNGLTQNESYDLQRRLQNVQQQLREDRQDGRNYDNNGRYDDDRRYDDRGANDERYYDRRDRNRDD